MAKGKKTGGGSRKGRPNKITGDLREMILGALNSGEGGQKYFEQQKADNPVAFMGLIGRLLPKDVHVSGEVKHTLDEMIAASFHERPADSVPASSRAH